jgi:hypothetical protein
LAAIGKRFLEFMLRFGLRECRPGDCLGAGRDRQNGEQWLNVVEQQKSRVCTHWHSRAIEFIIRDVVFDREIGGGLALTTWHWQYVVIVGCATHIRRAKDSSEAHQTPRVLFLIIEGRSALFSISDKVGNSSRSGNHREFGFMFQSIESKHLEHLPNTVLRVSSHEVISRLLPFQLGKNLVGAVTAHRAWRSACDSVRHSGR